MNARRPLPWLEAGDPFPPVNEAWGPDDPAPGLLAAGGALDTPTLLQAYRHGIFPWFSEGQPILWWSTDPRMVLHTERFHLRRSLRKTLQRLRQTDRLQIRFDHDFKAVITACASIERSGQDGTWILPEMVHAYLSLHQAGVAHSVETWIDGELAGGLYCVNIGGMVFGESMFSRRSDASKIALCALVAFCKAHAIDLIDCQQDTAHLSSMGGTLLSRGAFCEQVQQRAEQPAPIWQFENVYWNYLFNVPTPERDAS